MQIQIRSVDEPSSVFFTNVAKWNVDTNGEKDKIIVNFEYQKICYNQINKSASVRFLRNQIVRV